MQRILAAVFAASACSSSLQAQTPPSPAPLSVLSLDAALRTATANAPTTGAANAGRRAADAQRSIARLRPNPSIEAMAENVGGTGVYRGFRSTETTAGLALPIELGGKRSARIAVADTQIDRAQIESIMAAADLRLRVTQAYNDAAAAQRRTAITRDQRSIAAEGVLIARVRVKAGRASPIEEQRADVARITADNAADRAQRTAEAAFANLGTLIDAHVDSVDLSWFEAVAYPGPTGPIAIDNTLVAVAARADVATADAQVRLARSQRIPDMTISASARRLNASSDLSAVFGLSIPIPLFNAGRAGIALAAARRNQSDAVARAAALDARRSITSAQAEVANAAASAHSASGPAFAAATEAARIARIGYREGKFGQLDLLEAERTLAMTKADMIDALAAYHDAEARLERLTATASPLPENDR